MGGNKLLLRDGIQSARKFKFLPTLGDDEDVIAWLAFTALFVAAWNSEALFSPLDGAPFAVTTLLESGTGITNTHFSLESIN